MPKAETQRVALAQHIGADGMHVLAALSRADAPAEGKERESVQVLQKVWQQYDEIVEGKANWRAGPQKEDGEGVVRSPYDPEAQTGKKRETTWLGYNVHLTETCGLPDEPLCPQLIVQVQTAVAPIPDAEMTATIQEELVKAALKPEELIVDTMWTPICLLAAASSGSRWSVPRCLIAVGKPKQARASISRTSPSIGPNNKPPVRKGRPTLV
ncbi:MAG: hypothetical protein ABI234_08505 [Ktedonobacteraceae bacterium]